MAMNREREDEDMGRDQRLIHLAFGPQSQEGLIPYTNEIPCGIFRPLFCFLFFLREIAM